MKKKMFTLVEIMTVVGIIAVVLFMFGGNNNMHSSKMEETGMVLERVSTGVDKFRILNGGFPESWGGVETRSVQSSPSVHINDFDIDGDNPLGGTWTYSFEGNMAVITMVGVDSKFSDSMEMLDQIVDDGNLETGIFIAANDNYKYLLSRGTRTGFSNEDTLVEDGTGKSNNGHGNNEDGVDSSNKGNSKEGEDTDPNVDDEISKGNSGNK